MQKILFILVLFASIFFQSKSQDLFKAPDFPQIERNVKEQASSYYYPNLMKKYLSGTAQMNPEEGRHLYFGYVYQPEYVPTDTSEFNSKLAAILSMQSCWYTHRRIIRNSTRRWLSNGVSCRMPLLVPAMACQRKLLFM